MRITVRDIRASFRKSSAPFLETHFGNCAVSHFYVHPSLAHATAAHAGKIGFTADLERNAAVHQVIPSVPFAHTPGVHRADEVAHAISRANENLHRTRTIHRGQNHVWQFVSVTFSKLLKFGRAQLLI